MRAGFVLASMCAGLLSTSALRAQAVPGAGISGTLHDTRSWYFFAPNGYPDGQVCIMCHAPHNTSTAGPLWNHEMSTASYTLYTSQTMNAVVEQPGPTSKLCLSCHDGTVAILSYTGGGGWLTLADLYGTDQFGHLGTNLSNDHPIGISYNAALASADGSLADPGVATVTVGSSKTKTGTISALLLANGKVECVSCHDVHNKYTVGPTTRGLLRISMDKSALCLQCHTK